MCIAGTCSRARPRLAARPCARPRPTDRRTPAGRALACDSARSAPAGADLHPNGTSGALARRCRHRVRGVRPPTSPSADTQGVAVGQVSSGISTGRRFSSGSLAGVSRYALPTDPPENGHGLLRRLGSAPSDQRLHEPRPIGQAMLLIVCRPKSRTRDTFRDSAI